MTVKVSAAALALIHTRYADYCPRFPISLEYFSACASLWAILSTGAFLFLFLFLPFGGGGREGERPPKASSPAPPSVSLTGFPIRSRARTNAACTLHPVGDTGKARCEFLKPAVSEASSRQLRPRESSGGRASLDCLTRDRDVKAAIASSASHFLTRCGRPPRLPTASSSSPWLLRKNGEHAGKLADTSKSGGKTGISLTEPA